MTYLPQLLSTLFPYTTLFRSKIAEDGTLRDVGAPQITPHDAPEVVPELHGNRLVEMQLTAQPGDRRGVGAFAHHQIGRASCRERVEISVGGGRVKRRVSRDGA